MARRRKRATNPKVHGASTEVVLRKLSFASCGLIVAVSTLDKKKKRVLGSAGSLGYTERDEPMSSTRGQTQPRGRYALQALSRTRGWSHAHVHYDEREVTLAIALSECLDEMQKNGGNIDAALSRSPHVAADIKPLLEVAALLLPSTA